MVGMDTWTLCLRGCPPGVSSVLRPLESRVHLRVQWELARSLAVSEEISDSDIVGGGLPGLRGFSVATIVIGKAFRVILIDGARLASSE